jgi:aryl-alcohol dehydrogenase-like predicted oxidoreductase
VIADRRHLAAVPVCAQAKYNLIDRAVEEELAPACQELELSMVPFGPFRRDLQQPNAHATISGNSAAQNESP